MLLVLGDADLVLEHDGLGSGGDGEFVENAHVAEKSKSVDT